MEVDLFPLLPTAILVPSLNRASRLRDVANNIHEATPQPHYLIFCVGDQDSIAVLDEIGENYIDDSDCEDQRYVTRMNKLVRHLPPDAKTIFFGSDDVKHHQGWLAEALFWMTRTGASVVVVNDLHNPAGTQAVIRRDYLEEAVFDSPGDAFHHGYLHNFADTEQFEVARLRGKFCRAMDSFVEHLHPVWGAANSAQWDTTYVNAMAGWDQDLALFQDRFRRAQAAVR